MGNSIVIAKNYNNTKVINPQGNEDEMLKIKTEDFTAPNSFRLKNLFEQQLNQLYEEEIQILQVTEKFKNMVSGSIINNIFIRHLENIELQIIRLDDLFKILQLNTEIIHCVGLKSVIIECENLITQKLDRNLRDFSILSSLYKISCYKIASYLNLQFIAKDLNYFRAFDYLEESLNEEKHFKDEILNIMQKDSFQTDQQSVKGE